MKTKLLLLAIVTTISMGTISAKEKCDSTDKAIQKETQAKLDSINFEKLLKAIDSKLFVIQVDKFMHAKGYTNIASTMNFIMVRGDEVIVQLPGYAGKKKKINSNHLGGVTLNGSIKDFKVTTQKNGDRKISMQVNGDNIYITLFNGSSQAQARLRNGITVEGTLVPYTETEVVIGSYIDRRQD